MKQKIIKVINILDKVERNYLDFLKFVIEIIIWVLVMFLVLPILTKLFTSIFKIDIQLSDFILLITAAFVIAYTYETQKMKEEIKKQNEIQEKPILNLYLRESRVGSNEEYKIRLRNVGNGPAYNINFSSIDASKYIYYPYFNEPNPILEKNGDEKTVNLWVETPTKGVEVFDSITGFQFFLSRLFPSNANKKDHEHLKGTSAIFLISYQGINNKKYYSVFRLYSKIWPVIGVYDLVMEFINSGEGEYDRQKAQALCEQIETMKR